MKKELNGKVYYEDARGALVPEEFVKPIDQLRDDVVTRVIGVAQDLKETMQDVKIGVIEDIETFMQIAAEQHGVTLGGKKGNIVLTSYDGRYKVSIVVNDRQSFTEGIHLAKEIIDGCIERWSDGANANLKVLIDQAFALNQSGRMDTRRVLALRKLNIIDEEWNKAMDIIADAVQVDTTKTYFQIHKRDKDGKYNHQNLNFSDI